MHTAIFSRRTASSANSHARIERTAQTPLGRLGHVRTQRLLLIAYSRRGSRGRITRTSWAPARARRLSPDTSASKPPIATPGLCQPPPPLPQRRCGHAAPCASAAARGGGGGGLQGPFAPHARKGHCTVAYAVQSGTLLGAGKGCCGLSAYTGRARPSGCCTADTWRGQPGGPLRGSSWHPPAGGQRPARARWARRAAPHPPPARCINGVRAPAASAAPPPRARGPRVVGTLGPPPDGRCSPPSRLSSSLGARPPRRGGLHCWGWARGAPVSGQHSFRASIAAAACVPMHITMLGASSLRCDRRVFNVGVAGAAAGPFLQRALRTRGGAHQHLWPPPAQHMMTCGVYPFPLLPRLQVILERLAELEKKKEEKKKTGLQQWSAHRPIVSRGLRTRHSGRRQVALRVCTTAQMSSRQPAVSYARCRVTYTHQSAQVANRTCRCAPCGACAREQAGVQAFVHGLVGIHGEKWAGGEQIAAWAGLLGVPEKVCSNRVAG